MEFSDQDKNLPREVLDKLFDMREAIEGMSHLMHEDTHASILYPIEELLTANGFNFQETDF